ncbi:splicing factor 45 isoform X1 [Planococcus citri]|uniref:splicing factor 45 isoform X1 n=1 Tax=Planococcus citri TaxID=170843 RepID=UPI0031F76CD6
MSLYDDFDNFKQKTDQVAGWSSGIKLFQTNLQLKKAAQNQVKRDTVRKTTVAPVFDLKNKKDEEINGTPLLPSTLSIFPQATAPKSVKNIACVGEPQARDMDWNFEGNEYSPLWPNDYDKVVKDLRELRDREREREEEERRKRREERSRNRDKSETDDRRKIGRRISESSDEDAEPDRPTRGGVAIAPPPVLQDASSLDITPRASGPGGASVAQKIMAKYGFKEGQGLGKKEQGMSMALQVEKTSKRGGRIIHEKEIMPPPLMDFGPYPTSPGFSTSPTSSSQKDEKSDTTSITELMKTPSKVVLLKNMVGPGEVDQELEPEVKDECNTKYGDVVKVLIHELPNGEQEEAVRIFVEFKRIESAIKAVVDLNGRFFGGRQVKAGFYNQEKFASFQLLG